MTVQNASTQKDVLINFVLDKSGSMFSVRGDTIGGFNAFCQTQKQEGEKLGQATAMSLTLFDTTFELRYVNVDIHDIPILTEANYRPDGNTALYDAIGASIRAVEAEAPTGRVLFIIQTDGLENSSREWTRKAVFDLITQKRGDGWEFVFMGADQDAYAAAESIGVDRTRSLSYRGDRSKQAYEAVIESTSKWRQSRTEGMDISVHQEKDEDEKT